MFETLGRAPMSRLEIARDRSDDAAGSNRDRDEIVALAEEAEQKRAAAAKEAALVATLKRCSQCGAQLTVQSRAAVSSRSSAARMMGKCINCCGGEHQRAQQPPHHRANARLTLANLESHERKHSSQAGRL
eukprot:3422756-Prymnesium_polylepis.1